MTNTEIVKYCNSCQQLAGFYCNGCNNIFCENHAHEHRQSLYEQLDWLTVDHEDFIQRLNNETLIMKNYSSFQTVIDKWEEESIKNIKKAADDARRALAEAIKKHINNIKEKLKSLTEALHKASHINIDSNNMIAFDERDIKQWAAEIYDIKHEFIAQPKFIVRIHGNKPLVMPIIKVQPDTLHEDTINGKHRQSPLVVGSAISCNGSKHTSSSFAKEKEMMSADYKSVDQNDSFVSLKDDRFSQCSNHIKISENGQFITHDSTDHDASILGHHAYSQGKHKLVFLIEHVTVGQSIFFGIISKPTSLRENSYMESTVYGWAGYNRIYMNGKSMTTINGQTDEIKLNDFIELTIDCNKQAIFLWHSRQTYKNKLPIDIRTCPFPWQLLVSCSHKDDSVRLLPLSVHGMIKREQKKLNNAMKKTEIEMKCKDDSFAVVCEVDKVEVAPLI